jgi:hypothetical protein
MNEGNPPGIRNTQRNLFATTPERVGKVDMKSLFQAGGQITDEAL